MTTNELITRSFEIRSVDEELREVTGIAVPFDQTINAGGYKESFARGAIDSIENVKLFWQHSEAIGLVTAGEDTEDGFLITARISKTPRGDEAYTLLQDGVINRFSVGFFPVEDTYDADSETVIRTKVDLKEVSLVNIPAYDAAVISEVRELKTSVTDGTTNNERGHNEKIMTEINYATVSDLDEIRDAVDGLSRRVAVAGSDEEGKGGTHFRSAGEWVKALADNDDTAKTEIRVYTGATSADSHVGEDWKNDLLVIVDKGRPTLNLFNRGPLGSNGLTVNYPRISSITGSAASQVLEAADLDSLEVVVTTESAPVLTYGVHSELTRQAIQRSDVSYLDAVLRAQAASYAKVTNKVVRDALVGATVQTGTSITLSSVDASGILGAVVDAVSKIDANGEGAQAEFIIVSSDVWLKFASLMGTSDPVFNVGYGDQIGSANVRGIVGSIAGLPVVVDSGLAAKSFYIASSATVTSWESAGAPVRLQDENVVNLTSVFSLHGFLAVGVTNDNAAVKVAVA